MSTMRVMGSSPSIRKRRKSLFRPTLSLAPMMLCAFFAVGFLLPSKVTATIFLPEYNQSYVSLPARFGAKLSEDKNDPPIAAYLTLVTEQPYMCPDELKRIQPRPPFFSMSTNMMEENKLANNNITMDNNTFIDDNANQDILPLPAPSNDLPVALLVERGMCTFHEKAIMASKYGPFVKYIIIYDDQIASDLVPMSSENETDLALFFVSATTGRELLNYMASNQKRGNGSGSLMNGINMTEDEDENEYEDEYENENENDNVEPRFLDYNLLIEIDGDSPYLDQNYRGLNMAAYFLAAMSGFLAFLIFFGCLLICAQCGCITAAPDEHGRIVLFAGGPGIRHTEGLARMICVDKLTLDQVMLLDEEEYEAPSDEGNGAEGDSSACCAICLEEFEDQEEVMILPCNHLFHKDCLVPWLTERHASCPLCKMDMLKYVREIEKKNKKAGEPGDKESSSSQIEAPDGSPDDSSSIASQSSSTPRSFWFRLRGWSQVPDSSDLENTISTSNRSLGVSEIEMERMAPGTGNTTEIVAASRSAETAIDP